MKLLMINYICALNFLLSSGDNMSKVESKVGGSKFIRYVCNLTIKYSLITFTNDMYNLVIIKKKI
jgi:hypothetical protein